MQRSGATPSHSEADSVTAEHHGSVTAWNLLLYGSHCKGDYPAVSALVRGEGGGGGGAGPAREIIPPIFFFVFVFIPFPQVVPVSSSCEERSPPPLIWLTAGVRCWLSS